MQQTQYAFTSSFTVMNIIIVPKINNYYWLFKISELMIDLDSGLTLCFTVCFFIFSVNCGTPPVPSNGIVIPHTTGTTEGAQATILCRDIFHSSLLRDNYTVSTCTIAGQWDQTLMTTVQFCQV